MKIMATSFKRSCARIRHCCTQCHGPCSRPPPTHTSTRDSWTLTGKSGPVSCGATAPFFWVLVHTKFCLYSPRVSVSPVLWKFCNEGLLTFKVRFLGNTESLSQIPRLGSLLVGLEFYKYRVISHCGFDLHFPIVMLSIFSCACYLAV